MIRYEATLKGSDFRRFASILDKARMYYEKRHVQTAVGVTVEQNCVCFSLSAHAEGTVFFFGLTSDYTGPHYPQRWFDTQAFCNLAKGPIKDFSLLFSEEQGITITYKGLTSFSTQLPQLKDSSFLPEEVLESTGVNATFTAADFTDNLPPLFPLIKSTDLVYPETQLEIGRLTGIRLATTDSTRLCYVTVPYLSGHGYPDNLRKQAIKAKVLIPSQLLYILAPALSCFKHEPVIATILEGGRLQVCVETTPSVGFYLPIIDKTFPNYENICPKSQEVSLEIDSAPLVEVLNLIKRAQSEHRPKWQRVNLRLSESSLFIGYPKEQPDASNQDIIWSSLPCQSLTDISGKTPALTSIQVNLNYLLNGLPTKPDKVTLSWTSSSFPATIKYTEGSEYVFMPISH